MGEKSIFMFSICVHLGLIVSPFLREMRDYEEKIFLTADER